MANGNTNTGGYLAFPTFGGGGEGGGITQVKLPASQMRFPTSSYNPVRRAPEPTLKETIAPFLPMALEGIMGLFKDDPEMMTADEFYDTKGGPLAEDNTLKGDRRDQERRAAYEAYQLYGGLKEERGWGWGLGDDLVHMAIGSGMGRGASDYAASVHAINASKDRSRQQRLTSKAAFLSAANTKETTSWFNVENATAANVNVDVRRIGAERDGVLYVQSDDGKSMINVLHHPDDWIKQRPTGSLAQERNGGQNKIYDYLLATDDAIKGRESAAVGTIDLTNRLVQILDDEKAKPFTVMNAVESFANDMSVHVDSVLEALGRGSILDAFATKEDVDKGESPDGTGDAAKELWLAIQTDDIDRIEKATERFEKNTNISLKQKLGEAAFIDVRTRGLMLQLAYMVAAANGQTGKTLSDKDLAYHLDMVGFGRTDDASVAKENILDFVDTMLKSSDGRIQLEISENDILAGRYNLYDPLLEDVRSSRQKFGQLNAQIISSYYNIPETNVDEDGNLITGEKNWDDLENYQFKSIWGRHPGLAIIQEYFNHYRPSKRTFFDKDSPDFWTDYTKKPRAQSGVKRVEESTSGGLSSTEIDNLRQYPRTPPR